MVRSTQLLHPQREPAATRPAATVLLLRDAPGGFEVLMTRRSPTASFAPGAYVFPGGVIDAADHDAHAHAAHRPAQAGEALTQAIAAIRESFEELGVLFARHTDGRWASADDIAGIDRHGPFFEQCAARGLGLAADQVFVLARWITDRDLPRRFDVAFLVARMPGGQVPVADEAEQFEPVWVRPADSLARHEAGSFFMIFPTIRTLERLAKYADVDAVLAACAGEKPLWTSCPRAGYVNGADTRFMEHEMAYGELALTSPDGQLLHHLDWRTDQPVALLKNLTRVTAPNPGVMTGPGTNSYLVGDPRTGYIAIDPGPDEPEHLDRLWRVANGDIRVILCTHSHPDHSPGARPLQALCANRPPILGIASKPTARPASEFTPDREIADGEEVFVEGGGVRHTLRAIHTPGHAANHTCFLLVEDGLLFSGDHVLNGSTTVVDPPDGDMTAYLESLDKLAAACARHGVGFILPAHGHVLGFAPLAIAHLKSHRLAREAKIVAAMRAKPGGSMEDWVKLAYDDVPPRMWPVAQRSLLAHVQRIEAGAALATRRYTAPAIEGGASDMDVQQNAGIEAFPLEFTGSGGEYFRVWIVNVLLTIVTLGFYTPFARRRTAQYFYGHTDVAGSPLEFTAQKRKMLIGFLVLVLLIVIRNVAAQTGHETTLALFMLAGAALAPYFWASAVRFRLSATRWRGLRLQFTPRWAEVYKASWPVFAIALAWITVSFVFGAMVGDIPVARAGKPPEFPHVPAAFWLFVAAALGVSFMCIVRLEYNYKSLLVLRAHIGGEAGRWKPVYPDFLRTWLATLGVLLLSIILVAALVAGVVFALAGGASLLRGARPGTVGIVVFFILLPLVTIIAAVLVTSPARAYREARIFQLIWNNVGVSHIARFKCDLKPAKYVRLRIRNVLLTLLTLGFWRPFGRVSEHRMKVESVTLHVKGGLDQLMGQLARQQQGSIGDAVADAVGLDLVG